MPLWPSLSVVPAVCPPSLLASHILQHLCLLIHSWRKMHQYWSSLCLRVLARMSRIYWLWLHPLECRHWMRGRHECSTRSCKCWWFRLHFKGRFSDHHVLFFCLQDTELAAAWTAVCTILHYTGEWRTGRRDRGRRGTGSFRQQCHQITDL